MKRERGGSGWIVGVLAATGTLVVLGLISSGFYVSEGGLFIAGAFAFSVGTGAAAVADSRPGRNASIVALYIIALFAAYLLLLPALAGPVPPGARGGPGVSPPQLPGSK